jgi:hypothetical protein
MEWARIANRSSTRADVALEENPKTISTQLFKQEMFEVQGLQHSMAVVILQLFLFAPEARCFSMQFWCSVTSTCAAVLHCARHDVI